MVVVLPPDEAGELTRAHVYSAVTRGARHVSVVHAAGPALARAVAEVAAPLRITRLARVLTR